MREALPESASEGRQPADIVKAQRLHPAGRHRIARSQVLPQLIPKPSKLGECTVVFINDAALTETWDRVAAQDRNGALVAQPCVANKRPQRPPKQGLRGG